MVLFVLAALSSASLAAEPPHASIIGKWKSDAARTIDAVDDIDDISAEVRAAFTDDYFGHLVIEYRVDTVRAHFDNADYDSGFQPYEVVEVSDAYVITREWNEILRIYEESATYIDPPCIYAISAEYGFREYYCPIEQ